MLQKRFKIKNTAPINAAAIAASAVLIAAAGLRLYFYNVGGLIPAIVTAAALAYLSVTVLLTAFYSFYVLKEAGLSVRFGPFRFTVPYDNMRLLREDKDSKELFLIYLKESNSVKCLKILLPQENNRGFVEAVREKNRLTVYEIFDKKREFDDDADNRRD